MPIIRLSGYGRPRETAVAQAAQALMESDRAGWTALRTALLRQIAVAQARERALRDALAGLLDAVEEYNRTDGEDGGSFGTAKAKAALAMAADTAALGAALRKARADALEEGAHVLDTRAMASDGQYRAAYKEAAARLRRLADDAEAA